MPHTLFKVLCSSYVTAPHTLFKVFVAMHSFDNAPYFVQGFMKESSMSQCHKVKQHKVLLSSYVTAPHTLFKQVHVVAILRFYVLLWKLCPTVCSSFYVLAMSQNTLFKILLSSYVTAPHTLFKVLCCSYATASACSRFYVLAMPQRPTLCSRFYVLTMPQCLNFVQGFTF